MHTDFDAEHSVDILCLCNWHGVGGAQLTAGLLTAEFIRRGYRADLGFLFEREPEARHGTESHFVLAPRAPRTPTDWFRFIRSADTEVRRRRPRAIIGVQPMANVVGALLARRLGDCRMIATQHNPSDRQSRAVGTLEKYLGCTGFYHRNIAVSETVGDSFSAYPKSYRQKLGVIYNATPDLPETDEGRAACRARFGMPSGLVLGCLGRLAPQKNVAFALEVTARIPEASLYLAGEGPDEAALRSQAKALGIEDRVQFLGSIAGIDVTRFYRALDALLFCSIYEGFGRVLVEAMSQSTSVIASDLPITREVAGADAVLLPLDAAQWATSIIALMKDLERRAELIARARSRAAQFQTSAMIDLYLAAAGLPKFNAAATADE